MEDLNPAQNLAFHIKFGIERGQSIKTILQIFLSEPKNDLTSVVNRWLVLRESGQNPESLLAQVKSPYRQALLRTADRGLQGETIYPVICLMEQEINESIAVEMESFLLVLPLKMLVPLLLFQFPAFLLLLFGPLLKEILKSF